MTNDLGRILVLVARQCCLRVSAFEGDIDILDEMLAECITNVATQLGTPILDNMVQWPFQAAQVGTGQAHHIQ